MKNASNQLAAKKTLMSIYREADDFKCQFKVPNSVEYRTDVMPEEVLGKLHFHKVQMADLDATLRDGIRRKPGWNGHPLNTDGMPRPYNILMQSADKSILYSINMEGGDYSVARIYKTGNGYRIHPVEKALSVVDLIVAIADYEIIYKQTPDTPRDELAQDIPIFGLTPAKTAEETRGAIGQVMGLA